MRLWNVERLCGWHGFDYWKSLSGSNRRYVLIGKWVISWGGKA